MPDWAFRPGTPCYPMKLNFIFINGGMGDYTCWLRPIQWLAECATWIEGTLVCPNYLQEMARYFLKDHPHWKVVTYASIKDLPNADEAPFRGPVMLQNESLNATGGHLLTCGWVYFTNKEKAPDGNDSQGIPWDSYPRFKQSDLDSIELLPEIKEIKKYAVITTGITTSSRQVPGEYWNSIIEHVKARGLEPVFLGKSVVDTGNSRNIHTTFSDKINYNMGLDLRDKTTLMQAASIISRAAFIVGHDNGLLHIAGCTDTPIVFGYNLASPQHREPHRPVGRVYNVQLTKQELACNFCQSEFNFLIGFNFRSCYYSDNKCIDLLFGNGAEKWKVQINKALSESHVEHLPSASGQKLP
jgi:hypothetical protein